MSILFLLTGLICAFVVPIINYQQLGLKAFIFSIIMIMFALLVICYVILSIFKLKITKIDYLKSQTIVSWGTNQIEKNSKLPYFFSLLTGTIFGTYLIVNSLVEFGSVNLLNVILLSLACSFIVLGFWLMGIKRVNQKLDETGSFLLSHMGIILNDDVMVFNGYSKGIISAKKVDNSLILNIIKGKKESEIKLDIPNDKIEEVENFLKDLDAHFNGVSDEN